MKPLRPKLLIVDDNPINIVALEDMLDAEDVHVHSVEDGPSALALFERHEFALALLDVHMPGMTGVQLAVELRGLAGHDTTPIIFVSSDADDSATVFRSYAAGGVDYISRPVIPEVLLGKVRVFLELYRQRRELEESAAGLRRVQAELKRSNRALLEFAHAAAHDLRAPVRHIRMWSEVIREEAKSVLTREHLGRINEIIAATLRMNALISSLLNFAKVDARPPRMEPVDLLKVTRAVVTDLSAEIVESGARVCVGDLPDVHANPELMYQVIQNLIGNALKFRREGVAPVVDVTCEVDEVLGSCQISVSDNGAGFTEQEASAIFEPFRRLVTESEVEGTGIGLATVRKIAELHGGSIAATGRPGAGAQFDITLPLATAFGASAGRLEAVGG